RFHQIAGARARTQEGPGIGLSLVNELVRLHGGAVRVDSVIGQGTMFSVTLHKGIGHLPQDQISARRRGAHTPARAASVEGAMRWPPADARTANIPVVMLSACAGEETRIEGLQRGADDYLVKPFSGREVVARMNSQIALSQLARERRLLLAREQTARKEAELQKEYLHS